MNKHSYTPSRKNIKTKLVSEWYSKVLQNLSILENASLISFYSCSNKRLTGPPPYKRVKTKTFRDGPFDIQGGLGFFLVTSYFFSLSAQQVIFFKSKLQQVFYFLKK